MVWLAIVLGVAGLFVAFGAAARWSQAAEPAQVTTAAVKRGDVRSVVTASGTLSPLVQVEVGSQVSGRIRALHADFNDPVKKGQLIAEIAPELLQSALAQAGAKLESARAGLARAQAQAKDARARLARIEGLGDSGAVAKVDADTARADASAADAAVGSARADVTLAQAGVEQARSNLGYTKITSPIDGIVVSRSVGIGQTVAASLSAPTLFVLAEDLRKMELHTDVAESDVGQITPGQEVEFTVDAYPETVFHGSVRQLRYAAQTVSNVVTYDAVVQVDNPELKLRPGMTANATFVVAERKDALTVPNAALRYRPAGVSANAGGKGAGRGRTLWVLRDGQPSPVPVRLGLSDGTVTELLSDALREGDLAITADTTSAQGSAAPAAAQGNAPRGNNANRGGRARAPRIL